MKSKAIIQMLTANQKFSQISMGIDDDCVLVMRSAFIENRNSTLAEVNDYVGENVVLQDICEDCKSQIIAITLIWKQESFEKIQETKHRLAFLLGVLEKKEQQDQFITKELIKVNQQKSRLGRKIKDIFSLGQKDSGAMGN